MVVPSDGTSAQLQSLLNDKVDASVGDDDIPTLAEGWNDAGCGGETLAVDDGCLCTEERSDSTFEL